MVRRERPAAPGGAPPHLTWRPLPPQGMNGPRPPTRAAPTPAPQPRSLRRQGGRAGGWLSPSALARLYSAPPPPPPPRWRRSSRGVSASVREGPLHFLPPAAAAARSPPPPPCSCRGVPSGRGGGRGSATARGQEAVRRHGRRGCCEGRECEGTRAASGERGGETEFFEEILRARGPVKEGKESEGKASGK